MFPIVSRKRKEDESGQVVEGETLVVGSCTLLTDLPDWDMVFADDERESNPASFKFLQMAREWSKRAKSGAAPSSVLADLGSGTPATIGSLGIHSTAATTTKNEAESDVASSDEE
jgi:crooked neck